MKFNSKYSDLHPVMVTVVDRTGRHKIKFISRKEYKSMRPAGEKIGFSKENSKMIRYIQLFSYNNCWAVGFNKVGHSYFTFYPTEEQAKNQIDIICKEHEKQFVRVEV